VAASLPEFPPLWLNEVVPNNVVGITDVRGRHGAWLELVNHGSLAVSLDGWSLAASYTNLAQWPFPAGTVIQPGQFLLIFADGQSVDTTPTELHTNFRLNPTNGVIALSRPQLGSPAVVDYLDYNVPTADQSFGRDPDHFPGDTRIFVIPTPAAANPSALGNRPPTLATIGGQIGYVGQPLSVLVTATDPDAGQTFTYTLPEAVPAGAAIHPATGQFSWTPSAGQTGTTSIHVSVTDNGAPPLSDDETFTVNVFAPATPTLSATVARDGTVTLTWPAQIGLRYWVEVRDSLTTAWQPLTELTATVSPASVSDNGAGRSERFYRLVVP
jgi:hypothetical protein